MKTNYMDRWITNNVVVTMPRNLFMDVFHTNYVAQYSTNVIDVFRTNYLAAYQTNQVDVFVTNTVPVNVTNLAQAWVTNTRTFWLTNLTTVVSFKTNLVSLVATNVVEIDVPASAPAPVPEPARPAAVPVAEASSGPVTVAVATAPAKLSGFLDVRLSARAEGARVSEVVSWTVQSENGAMMFAGRDAEFRRDLPPGRYTVEVITPGKESKPLKTRSTLVVDERRAAIAPQPPALRQVN